MTILESLIAEAREQAVGHPSKDARFFANSVLKYLTSSSDPLPEMWNTGEWGDWDRYIADCSTFVESLRRKR
jgi:hypothetical protein